jgi:peptide/nickel transport system permease protein
MGFALFGISTPVFWLGLMALYIFWRQLGWVGGTGYVSPLHSLSGFFSHMITPWIVLALLYAALYARMTRNSLLETLGEDYIRTARAKGLINKLIINRHALKNALLPVVTLIGIEFAFLIGGLVVTEQVFNLNGVGRLFVQAVQNQDYTLTQALVMLTVMVFVICNLIVDLLYAWLDPRIRFS